MLSECIRVRFEKTGRLKYISHLDLQRTFCSGLNRSKLPIWYSKGFNPHPKLVFALTVSVGTESVCELLDIRLDEPVDADYALERLRASFTSELNIIKVYEPTRKFNDIKWSEYEICAKEGNTLGIDNAFINEFTKGEIVITRRTKSGDKTEDIKPMIKNLEIKNEKLYATLAAGCDVYLNPVYLIKAIQEYSKSECDFSVKRIVMYDENMNIFE